VSTDALSANRLAARAMRCGRELVDPTEMRADRVFGELQARSHVRVREPAAQERPVWRRVTTRKLVVVVVAARRDLRARPPQERSATGARSARREVPR